MRTSRWAAGLAAAVLALSGATTAGTATAAATAVAPSSAGGASGPGSHDTLFPDQGHGGYDVLHYDVHLRYASADGTVEAATTISARATHRLTTFALDLRGMTVRHLTVDGRPAHWTRRGTTLVVEPAEALTGAFRARVVYAGRPTRIVDSDGSTEGWVRTRDGAIGLGEPLGTMAWVPVDDTPGDKATWTFHVDVPSALQVAANGDLLQRRTHDSRTTWVWNEADPMAAYLATVAIGHFDVYHSSVTSVTGRSIPIWSFVDPTAGAGTATARAKLPGVLSFEEGLFGPYPFSSTGMIVDDARVGYALETQTRPFYPGAVSALVHEMAHQWFGDSVTVVDWHDLWLAEGFATYAEWLWDAAHDGPSTQATFDRLYAEPASSSLWRPAPTTFTHPADLFGDPVYERGAMTLQALRVRIGDDAFFTVLKDWAAGRRHGNARTSDFVALAERVSGQQLDGLFRDWLVKPGRPSGY